MASLTQKQEAFCLAYVETGNASEAYRRSYNAENSKPESINVNASKMLADAKVAQRVEELRSELVAQSLWTRENSVKALINAYKVAEVQQQAAGMTGAVKELNAMHGFNAPSEVNVTSRSFVFTVKRASPDA